MRPIRTVLIAAGLAAAAVGPTVATTSLAPATPAAADPPVNCEVRDAGGQCVATNHRPTSGGTGASSRGPLTCTWVGFADQAYGHSLFPPPENTLAHDGGAIVFYDCGRPQGNGEYDPWERVGANGTLGDGSFNLGHIERAYPWRAPAEIAEDLLAQVIADLPPPVPVISPPPSGAAIIEQPTFVAVDNWPGVIGPLPACDGPVCVEITAVPTLMFTPGDGSDPIACAGRGTLFDARLGAPEPSVQAEGACAHIYDRRTTGQPFPGSVAIHWEVTWTSQTPDDDGVIDVIPQGVPVPRQVDEVQGIVVEPEDGEG
jgi:hypothetical protein